ncbi:hypothetical protein [Falsiroseomonas sp. HW251]|uniref:hypothetical protein n=1 Tax=Falsiroseomonas sp. HW251 TaxID=3390998 RepID=UPI003D3125A1
MAKALLKTDLVIGVHRPAYDAHAKRTVDGDEMLLKLTDDGLRAVGIDPNAGDTPEEDEQSAGAIARRNAERRAAATAADTAPTDVEEPAPQGKNTPAPEAPRPRPRPPRARACATARGASSTPGATRTTSATS